jgi:hypothetical protein
MKNLFGFVVLFLWASVSMAACLSPPREGMTLDQVMIQTNRVDGIDVTNIITAYPMASGEICCARSVYDRRLWQQVLDGKIPSGTQTLRAFITGITAPGSDVALTAQELAICQDMVNRMVVIQPPPAVPAVYIIVAPISGQTSRPLYGASFATIGRVEFLLNGTPRVCEPTPVYKTGSTVKYYWVTNNAGQRGLAVCKPG